MTNARADDWVSTGEAARYLGLTTRTMREYTRRGVLPDHRSPAGQRIFRVGDLETLRPRQQRSVVLYARVSSRRQQAEGDLARQLARLECAAREQDRVVHAVYTDVASGLAEKRPGLRAALAACALPEVDTLLVSHPERLARFGTGPLEQVLSYLGVSVQVLGEDEALTGSEESALVRDMLAVVTSFSGRLYGQRSEKARQVRSRVAEIVG